MTVKKKLGEGAQGEAIFVAFVGVDDTFGTDEALHGFYKTVLQLFSEKCITEGVTE